MTASHLATRRGAALLIVLATLVLVAGASVTLARLGSSAKVQRTVVRRTIIADDMLRAAEEPILAWLDTESSTVVLSPDASTPEVAVLHDKWVVDERAHELRITAWDQCGMVPLEIGRTGSSLRLAVPHEVLGLVDRVRLPRGHKGGLDLFLGLANGLKDAVFPEATRTSAPLVFGEPVDGETSEPADTTEPAMNDRPPLGAYVASHNPGRVNVNTAPLDLLERALRLAGRGGIDQIVEARSNGEAFMPQSASEQSPQRPRRALEISGQSNAWAFRIDLAVGLRGRGAVRRSWWSVYVEKESNWSCVQRLAIPE